MRGGGPGAPRRTVTVASYVLADLDTGAVLAARAPHERQRPASTLKVLTSLVVLARLDPDTVVDGTAEDLRVDGSKVGIGPGGHYTVRQLLQGLLLNSGNDAADALARALGGDAAAVAAMSETARGLGALDTRPATLSGLDGPGMATSAYDLALLFRVAMRDPLFAATTATRTVPFPGYGDHPGFVVVELRPVPAALSGARSRASPGSPTRRGTRDRGARSAAGTGSSPSWCAASSGRCRCGSRPRPCWTRASPCRRERRRSGRWSTPRPRRLGRDGPAGCRGAAGWLRAGGRSGAPDRPRRDRRVGVVTIVVIVARRRR